MRPIRAMTAAPGLLAEIALFPVLGHRVPLGSALAGLTAGTRGH